MGFLEERKRKSLARAEFKEAYLQEKYRHSTARSAGRERARAELRAVRSGKRRPGFGQKVLDNPIMKGLGTAGMNLRAEGDRMFGGFGGGMQPRRPRRKHRRASESHKGKKPIIVYV